MNLAKETVELLEGGGMRQSLTRGCVIFVLGLFFSKEFAGRLELNAVMFSYKRVDSLPCATANLILAYRILRCISESRYCCSGKLHCR